MDKVDTEGQAYPTSKRQVEKYMYRGCHGRSRTVTVEAGGMTLLDYFAGQALKGMLIYDSTATDGSCTHINPKRARDAYSIAAAMIAEKRRREEPLMPEMPEGSISVMMCLKCAKKLRLRKPYQASELCSFSHRDSTPCYFCGKHEGECEIEIRPASFEEVKFLRPTPARENAEELRKLVKTQKRLITTLRRDVEYHSGMKASHEKDYLPCFVPREVKHLKQALKVHKKAHELLATINQAEALKQEETE